MNVGMYMSDVGMLTRIFVALVVGVLLGTLVTFSRASVRTSDDVPYFEVKVLSAKLVEGKLEVVRERTDRPALTQPTNRRVWKEIYGARNDKIVLLETRTY